MGTVRRVFAVVGVLLLLGCLVAAIGLFRAHRAIAREGDPLPSLDDVAATLQAFTGDAPIGLSRISTSSQVMGDGRTLGHPSFVLRWRDGRILLVDLGMTRETALAFGVPFEWVMGAEPAVFHQSVAAALGDEARNVRGVVFTHLHTDHVDGVREMCPVVRGSLNVLMTPAQATRPNYTTQPGLQVLHDTMCVLRNVVEGAGLRPLPGFPGVFVFHAGGHTPGSQIIFAALETAAGRRGVVFSGDITNDIASIDGDLPKPWIYRNLIIPEAEERQGELRRFLRALRDDKGMALLVAHDERNADRVLAALEPEQS